MSSSNNKFHKTGSAISTLLFEVFMVYICKHIPYVDSGRKAMEAHLWILDFVSEILGSLCISRRVIWPLFI